MSYGFGSAFYKCSPGSEYDALSQVPENIRVVQESEGYKETGGLQFVYTQSALGMKTFC